MDIAFASERISLSSKNEGTFGHPWQKKMKKPNVGDRRCSSLNAPKMFSPL